MARPPPAPLPTLEQTLYWLFGISTTSYCIYSVYLLSQSVELQSSPHMLNLERGWWPVLGTLKDAGDHEWTVWSTKLLPRMLPGFLLHLTISQATRVLRLNTTTQKILLFSCGAVASCLVLSWRYLLLTALTPCVLHLVSTLGSVPAVWLALLAITAVINAPQFDQYLNQMLLISTYEDHFVLIYEYAFVVIRSTVYALERIWSLKEREHTARLETLEKKSSGLSKHVVSELSGLGKPSPELIKSSPKRKSSHKSRKSRVNSDSTDHSSCQAAQSDTYDGVCAPSSVLYGWPVLPKVPGILDGLLYVFYVPFLFNGPPMTCDKFISQFEAPQKLTWDRLQDIAWCLVRIIFWFFFNHALLHLVFFTSLSQAEWMLADMDRWTVYGTALLLGQFMTNKYVVIYGLPAQVAKMDGLQPAAFPACISYIYKYSDMWKSFDRGLYEYLRRYIYIPCGGSKAGFLRAELSSLATFTFMGFWHGGRPELMVWAGLNFLEVNLETAGAMMERSTAIQDLLLKRLSPAADARLRAALSMFLFELGTTSNMFFLSGSAFATLYATKLFSQCGPALLIFLSGYSMIQVSRHLERLKYTKY